MKNYNRKASRKVFIKKISNGTYAFLLYRSIYSVSGEDKTEKVDWPFEKGNVAFVVQAGWGRNNLGAFKAQVIVL